MEKDTTKKVKTGMRFAGPSVAQPQTSNQKDQLQQQKERRHWNLPECGPNEKIEKT
jgi:hypothetical protein